MSGRQSLAGAFAPVAPGRGAALQGLLPPKRGRDAQAPKPHTPEKSVEAPVRQPVVSPPSAAPEVEQTPSIKQASPEVDEQEAVAPAVKASETVPGALRNVGVYLPPPLLAAVKDAVYQGRTTYADLLIDAFEAVDDERIADEFTPETMLTSSGMPRRAPRKRGEAGIQIQLRLDGLQVAWLDGKVTEFGAPSRSALVSAVFKLHMQAGQTAEE